MVTAIRKEECDFEKLPANKNFLTVHVRNMDSPREDPMLFLVDVYEHGLFVIISKLALSQGTALLFTETRESGFTEGT